MAYNFSQLIVEVQERLGRASDTTLVDTARVGEWVNRAQRDIVRENPGLRDVGTLDKTSMKALNSVYEYDTQTLFPAPMEIAHVRKLKYINTTQTDYHVIEPYPGGLDAWDAVFPYIPGLSTGVPEHFILRDHTIEIEPMPGSDQNNVPIWVHYDRLPPIMDATAPVESPLLVDFDDEIIELARAMALRSMEDRIDEARESEDYANGRISKRVSGEADTEEILQMMDNGP